MKDVSFIQCIRVQDYHLEGKEETTQDAKPAETKESETVVSATEEVVSENAAEAPPAVAEKSTEVTPAPVEESIDSSAASPEDNSGENAPSAVEESSEEKSGDEEAAEELKVSNNALGLLCLDNLFCHFIICEFIFVVSHAYGLLVCSWRPHLLIFDFLLQIRQGIALPVILSIIGGSKIFFC